MAIKRKSFAVLAVATVALAGTLAACGGSSDKPGSASGSGSKGGTLYVTGGIRPPAYLDPQRIYTGVDIAWLGRTMYRSLVQAPESTDATATTKVVPDLATDTGTSSDNAKVWKFTLRDGPTWQDGKPVTCADLKYGISRTFGSETINGGPTYAISLLDIPKAADGSSQYKGPYKGTGQALFDKAVSCSGKTITYRFNSPFPDFPLAIANLRAFDPYRKDQDKGVNSIFSAFSDGPYELSGAWDKDKGGTLIRNPKWDASTDPADIRKALPNKIVFTYGDQDETIMDRLIADSGNDKNMITFRRVPPTYITQIGAAQDRYKNVSTPYVDYLVPNVRRLTNPKVRLALAVSTDRTAWINAGGGAKFYKIADSIINPSLLGYAANPAFKDVPAKGDPAMAKQLLTEAGVKMPYPIKFTYSGGTPTSDNQAASLKAAWDKAGFKVTLDPLTGSYYDVINKPTADFDVTWAGWGADWPVAKSVLPPLFDGRINITSASNGSDYGNYESTAFDKLIDQAAQLPTVSEQAAKYAEADAQLGKDVAYFPLEISLFNWLYGSNVTGYEDSVLANSYPDLAGIGVK
ncbi:MAG: transporter substrate-binding protein [Marmoricola sp.]|nr:transporter substrate-binding protein [Marmoricola sp.]